MTTWWSNQVYRPSFHIVVSVVVRHGYAGRAVACQTGQESVAYPRSKHSRTSVFRLVLRGGVSRIPAKHRDDRIAGGWQNQRYRQAATQIGKYSG